MIDREQIGIRIAALRKKAGLSQQSLAEKLGSAPRPSANGKEEGTCRTSTCSGSWHGFSI